MASVRNPHLFDTHIDIPIDNDNYKDSGDRISFSIDSSGVLTEIKREDIDGKITNEIFSYKDISDEYDYDSRFHITSDTYDENGMLIEHNDYGTDYRQFDSSDIYQSPDTSIKYEYDKDKTIEHHYKDGGDELSETRTIDGDNITIEKFIDGESQSIEIYKDIDGTMLSLVESVPSGDSVIETWQPNEIVDSSVLTLERDSDGSEKYISYETTERHDIEYSDDEEKYKSLNYGNIEITTEVKYDENGDVSEKVITTTRIEEYMDAGGTAHIETCVVETYDADGNLVKSVEDSDMEYKGDNEIFERDKTHIETTVNENGSIIEDKTETHFEFDEREFETPVTKDEVIHTVTETDANGDTHAVVEKYIGSEDGEYSRDRDHRLVSETTFETDINGDLKETSVTEYGKTDSDGDLIVKHYDIDSEGNRELTSKEIVNESEINSDKETNPDQESNPDSDPDPDPEPDNDRETDEPDSDFENDYSFDDGDDF